mgnify:CR=1 FL=1
MTTAFSERIFILRILSSASVIISYSPYGGSRKTIPNFLSYIRLLLIPAIAVLFVKGHLGWSIGLIALSGLTDLFDGKIARKYNLVTDFGKFMDAVADKIMIFGALLALVAKFAIAGEKTFAVQTGSFWGIPIGDVVSNTNAQIMFNVLLWASIIVFLHIINQFISLF